MNRRDLLGILGIIIWSILFFYIIPLPEASIGFIKRIILYCVAIDVYLISLLVLCYIFPKFGDWGDKKLFKK